jgi:hypothetical protein
MQKLRIAAADGDAAHRDEARPPSFPLKPGGKCMLDGWSHDGDACA